MKHAWPKDITLGLRCNQLKSLSKSLVLSISIKHALITLRKDPLEALRGLWEKKKKYIDILCFFTTFEILKPFQTLSQPKFYTPPHKTV